MKITFLKRTSGFTLAELMAVVAIIAILSGIALGSYRKAMERTVVGEGEQMVHALATAADTYYYDNGSFPTALSKLDAQITGATVSGDSATTPNFVYKLYVNSDNPSYVDAVCRTGKVYTLRAYMQADGQKTKNGALKQSECIGQAGFCQSIGYANCSVSNENEVGTCVKY